MGLEKNTSIKLEEKLQVQVQSKEKHTSEY